MEYYYSELKRNEPSSHEKTRKNLQCIQWCERSQNEKAAYLVTPTTWHSGKAQTLETVKGSVVAGVSGGEEQAEHRGLSGQRNYSAWYYDGHESLHVCPTHRTFNTQTELQCQQADNGTLGNCQCRFCCCNKSTTWRRTLAVLGGGEQGLWKIFVASP